MSTTWDARSSAGAAVSATLATRSVPAHHVLSVALVLMVAGAGLVALGAGTTVWLPVAAMVVLGTGVGLHAGLVDNEGHAVAPGDDGLHPKGVEPCISVVVGSHPSRTLLWAASMTGSASVSVMSSKTSGNSTRYPSTPLNLVKSVIKRPSFPLAVSPRFYGPAGSPAPRVYGPTGYCAGAVGAREGMTSRTARSRVVSELRQAREMRFGGTFGRSA